MCRVHPLLSGYYVKASLLVTVYLMLGGSNQDYDRVRVSARTAFASTAILTLALGAATARERVPRPTADQLFLFSFCSFLPFFPPFFSFSFFYLLSGIWRDAFRLVMVNGSSLSFSLSTFPSLVSSHARSSRYISLFLLIRPIATNSANASNSYCRENARNVAAARRPLSMSAAFETSILVDFSLWRARISSPFLRQSRSRSLLLSFSLGGY